jgi:pimeloyl-ACP methyl ester carboxylesterase
MAGIPENKYRTFFLVCQVGKDGSWAGAWKGLGVVEANARVYAIWDQLGFEVVEKRTPKRFGNQEQVVIVLDSLEFHEPLVLMGCSMGGGMAMDFVLTYPERVRALIMVDSGPSGLELDVPESPKHKEAEQAFEAGDLERVAELETQIWFDGLGRTPEQVDQPMRKLLTEIIKGIDRDHQGVPGYPGFGLPADFKPEAFPCVKHRNLLGFLFNNIEDDLQHLEIEQMAFLSLLGRGKFGKEDLFEIWYQPNGKALGMASISDGIPLREN